MKGCSSALFILLVFFVAVVVTLVLLPGPNFRMNRIGQSNNNFLFDHQRYYFCTRQISKGALPLFRLAFRLPSPSPSLTTLTPVSDYPDSAGPFSALTALITDPVPLLIRLLATYPFSGTL